MNNVISSRRVDYKFSCPRDSFMTKIIRNHIEFELLDCIKLYDKAPRLIDIGCGNQPFRTFVEQIGFKYTGMDIYQNDFGSVDFIASIDSDISKLSIPQYDFDVILCTEVLEHVATWDTAFENFSKLLKEKGKILITCPHIYPLHEEPFDFWRPTIYAIDFMARKHGFAVLKNICAGNALDVLGTILGSFYTLPSTRNNIDRIINRLFHIFNSAMTTFVSSELIRNRVLVKSNLYLSNILVAEKI
ncbi:class I SAM-dependent methyltransferase [Synechocystis sp. FACHB-383]|uniref:class I SAM-dependent methyltransferase n=1 Tax=Synechocystis sp. FACHB-383 TaxID=2692864 RepID=UPI00168228A9|nr:class I SAM-dependent methyltransferase [Synechocystis sp. FACHB-383]MBD2654463.1 class I SAM-dependent methyltransferase [Synechocystis sp. FACHB-383]